MRLSLTAYRRLVVSETLSLSGDRLLGVALPLFVLDRTGSAALTAVAVLASAVPLALFGVLGGAVVDRSDRRRVLVAASAARSVLALPLLLVVAGLVPLAVLFVLMAALSAIGQLTGPAVGASLPALVQKGDLPRANAQLAARNVVVQLLAPTVGAGLYGWSGFEAVVAVDAVLFAAAALGYRRLHVPPAHRGSRRALTTDIADGFRYVRRDPVLARVVAAVSLGLVGLSLELAVLVPFVRQVLDGPPASVGLLTSVEAVGGLLAALTFSRLHRRLGTGRVLALGMTGLPAATVGLLVSQTVLHAAPGLLLAGLLLTLLTAAVRVHVQTSVERAYLGRVIGVIGSAVGASAVLGSLLAIGLSSVVDLRVCLAVAVFVETAGVAVYLSGARAR